MGVVHLDAGVVIGLRDTDDAHHGVARRALAGVVRDGHRVAMAASALAECFVDPYRRGEGSVEVVHGLIKRLPIEVVALDPATAALAAQLRAQHLSCGPRKRS